MSESTAAMEAAGFRDIVVAGFKSVLECPLDGIIDFLEQGTVRMTMILRRQSPEARGAIDRAIREGLSAFSDGTTIRVGMPAVVVAGTRL